MSRVDIISNDNRLFVMGEEMSPVGAIKFAEEIIEAAKEVARCRLLEIEAEKEELVLAAYYDPAQCLISEQV